MSKPVLFVTNDDGIEAPGIQALIRELNIQGYPLFVLAPSTEQSATGMRISVRKKLKVTNRRDIADKLQTNQNVPLKMYSLDGSPCDCVIAALDGGIKILEPDLMPTICISGVNQGPNISVDIMHSGTVSAARESALYGLPSIAVSLATYEHSNFEYSVKGAVKVLKSCLEFLPLTPSDFLRKNGSKLSMSLNSDLESIRKNFAHGNIFLNLNAPVKWNGKFSTVSLGSRWYRNAIRSHELEDGSMAFEVGAAEIIEEEIPNSDCFSVNLGEYAISPISSWPVNHPLGVTRAVLDAATISGENGLPIWLN
jgi:5'/3'-nucleotidase SurE